MTAFAGIDFDTHAIHVVLLSEEGPPRYLPFVLTEYPRAFERTRTVRDVMPARGWWEDEGVIAVGIEEPMGRGSVVQKLNVVQGAVLACLPSDLLVNPMRPSTWRVAAGLAGNASKDDVQAFVRERLGENPHWPQDAFDALCLALAVESLTIPA